MLLEKPLGSMLLNNKNTKRKEILIWKTWQNSTEWQNYMKWKHTAAWRMLLPFLNDKNLKEEYIAVNYTYCCKKWQQLNIKSYFAQDSAFRIQDLKRKVWKCILRKKNYVHNSPIIKLLFYTGIGTLFMHVLFMKLP